MTGQPTEQNENQQDEQHRASAAARAWDARTAALAARLESLLEQHRARPDGDAAAGPSATPPGPPRGPG